MLKKRYIETKTAGKGSYRLEKRTAWQTYVD
jgi:stalled ribosome alternative rescue factor ArfA